MYPYLWIGNGLSKELAQIVFDGRDVRWKMGPAYKQKGSEVVHIHVDDLRKAADLMRGDAPPAKIFSFTGSQDHIPMALHGDDGKPTDREIEYTFILEAMFTAERIDWDAPDAYKKYLEEVGGPEDMTFEETQKYSEKKYPEDRPRRRRPKGDDLDSTKEDLE